MSKQKRPKTNAQPPEKLTGLKLGSIPDTAGGLTAVGVALQHVQREMGTLRGFKLLSKLNQHDGFDCPGCAWPDPDKERSAVAEYCENGAKAVAEEATLKRVDAAFFAKHSVASLAELSDYEIGKMGRLTEPMLLEKGAKQYQPISWTDAFKRIAVELNGLQNPNEAIFYTSGRTSNEAAFLYQLFVRLFGTNNLPDCSNMCHESSGQALSQTLGIGKGSVTLEDIHNAEVIMVVGQNPGTNHPRMLSALQKCKRNGGKIIAVNPLPETGLMGFKHPQQVGDLVTGGTSLTDIFLQVRINGDVPLAKALLLMLLEAEEAKPGSVFDHEFIEEYCSGYKELIGNLKKQKLHEMIESCGVEEALLREAADLLIKHDKIIVCWAMGLTQHKNAVTNIKELVNLLLLKGAIGREGAGTCPVRGHSNVQGDRTMGIWEAPKEAFLQRLSEEFNFEAPREHGYSVVPAIEAMHKGDAKVFIAMGGNFISATPDTEYTAEALRNCDLTVQISTKLNRSHLIHGKRAIILPCLGRTEKDVQEDGEQFVSVENSMGVVHRSRGSLKPASKELLSEPAIIAGLATAILGENSGVDWHWHVEDYDRIRDAIEACIPGFEDY
ncbi:MAG: FdhF/YdeP family oxidoreductase, partial [Calditrichota bacterium]